MSNYSTDWQGCGDCDSGFSCFNGENRCIRLPKQPNKPITFPIRLKIKDQWWYPFECNFASYEGIQTFIIYATSLLHANSIVQEMQYPTMNPRSHIRVKRQLT